MEVCTCIVPCFNEEEAIPYYYEEMQKVMQKVPELDFELLFVDDGSCDGTLKVLKELAQKDSGVRKLWKGSSTLRRASECRRRLCSDDGCGSTGSSVIDSGNV